MSVYETIKMSPLLGLQGSGGGLAYLAGLAGGDKVYVDDVFSTTLYVGDSNAGSQVVNTGIDNTEESMVWIKSRTTTFGHNLFDTVRGTGYRLSSDNTDAQVSDSSGVTAFNSNGITIGGSNYINGQNANIVAWNFKAAPGFFDVVTYTGNGVSGLRAINHNLGSTPAFIIVKYLDGGSQWYCWHKDLTSKNYYILLNDTGAQGNAGAQVWEATDTTFSIHSGVAGNGVGKNYVAYLFADDDAQFGTDGDESIIKCGTYAGNGSTTTVNVGFEPQWLLVKASDANYGWAMLDNMRGISTGSIDDRFLSANGSDEEQGQDMVDLTPTGFIAKTNSNTNANNKNYIYMAIRRPNKPPEVGTDVFAIDTYTGSIPNYISGFPVDFVINRDGINSGNDVTVFSRLLGTKRLKTNSTESVGNAFVAAEMDHNNGYAAGTGTSPDSEKYSWMFKRAPGFMDVVAYSGNSTSGRALPHNLGVVPELMVFKSRDGNRAWRVYDANTGAGGSLRLNADAAKDSNSAYYSTPTADNIILGNDNDTNSSSYDYIAYLFATLTGISKVGSYTGTGNAINVPCGFTNGVRFLMIKRTDASGDWYVWDSVRGITSGNDPYLLLNRDNNGTDAQVTNTDYVDPLTSGFTVTASAPAALNANGGTYLFFAIA